MITVLHLLDFLVIQDYPAMYIMTAIRDDVIPFEGVKMYVEKLQHCIKQYARGQVVEYCESLQIGVRSISISVNLIISTLICTTLEISYQTRDSTVQY